MLSGNEMAELLATESIKRFGFVVVNCRADRELVFGRPVPNLWHDWIMPQPFTPVRLASVDEWDAQTALFAELFPGYPMVNTVPAKLVAFVTD